MSSKRIDNILQLSNLLNDEEAKWNVTYLRISRCSNFSESLSLSGFANLEELVILGEFKGTRSVEISSTSLKISVMNRSS